jgi:hypothetical protein
MYSLLIDTYVKGETEKQNLFNSVQVETLPSSLPLSESRVLSCCIEGCMD